MGFTINPISEGKPDTSLGSADFKFREAASTLNKEDSYNARMEKVRQACSRKFGSWGDTSPAMESSYGNYAYVEEVFDKEVVFRRGDKLYAVEYSWDDNDNVVLDETPRRVRPTFTTVKEKTT